MMPPPSVTREDSSDLAFATDCMLNGVVTYAEFRYWVYCVADEMTDETFPSYLSDILDMKEQRDFGWNDLGFLPRWNPTAGEADAVIGLGYKRSPDYRSDHASRSDALAALAQNPHIEGRLHKMFPFLEAVPVY